MMNACSFPPHLLWFDLRQEDSADDTIGQFAESCRISRASSASLAGLDLQLRPDMICLQYDRPDALGLNLLLAIKREAPSIPLTMLTVQHSEELAIWAFRSGAWDYLVLPLANAERQRYLRALKQLCELRRNPPRGRQKRPLERVQELPESVRLTTKAQKQQPLERVMQHIQQHFREPLDQKSMADLCNMTPIRFSRAFKDVYGVGFLEFVQSKRMEHAHELLLNSQMPVSSIAYASGFKDPSYFTRAFRQHYGLSPSELRSRNAISGLKLPVLPKTRDAQRGWSERLAFPEPGRMGMSLPAD